MSRNSRLPYSGAYFNTLWRERERFIRKEDVRQLVGLSYSTIWRKMKKGQFPQSLKAPGGCAMWFESEILEWLNQAPKAA